MLTRGVELADARWPDYPSVPVEVYETTRMAIALTEHVLTQCGWRRMHPAVSGLMARPNEQDVDLRALVTCAITDTLAADELRRLLEAATG